MDIKYYKIRVPRLNYIFRCPAFLYPIREGLIREQLFRNVTKKEENKCTVIKGNYLKLYMTDTSV